MKSLLAETGFKKIIVVFAGLFVGIAILIALLEQVTELLTYYFA